MNKFVESSKLERKKMLQVFEKNNITDYEFTDENGFDKYDGIFTKKDGTSIVYEVKNRNIPSNRYLTTIIERSKYEYLIGLAKTTGSLPYIFIFFTDGKYFVQNLLEANVLFVNKNCPKTTAGNNQIVAKELVEITIDKNRLYEFN